MFIPTACHRCIRTWLALPTFEVSTVCPTCQGPTEVVPGECYRADDVPLFERIEKAVVKAQLSEQPTYRLWATLSNTEQRWRRPDRLLAPLVDAIPSLQFLLFDFVSDRLQLARAVGMSVAVLTTQLRAAEARRQAPPAAERSAPDQQLD